MWGSIKCLENVTDRDTHRSLASSTVRANRSESASTCYRKYAVFGRPSLHPINCLGPFRSRARYQPHLADSVMRTEERSVPVQVFVSKRFGYVPPTIWRGLNRHVTCSTSGWIVDGPILQSFCKEAVLWKRLSHPHIVPFLGVTLQPLQLVSGWMPGGELRNYVRDNPYTDLVGLVSQLSPSRDVTSPPPRQLLGVAEGLAYLHSCNVIHGDLKGVCYLAYHCAPS